MKVIGEETDYEALRRILERVVKLEETDTSPARDTGILVAIFPGGTQLRFCCSPNGRLDMIMIQNAEAVRKRKVTDYSVDPDDEK